MANKNIKTEREPSKTQLQRQMARTRESLAETVGEMLSTQNGVAFSSAPGDVDVALLGARTTLVAAGVIGAVVTASALLLPGMLDLDRAEEPGEAGLEPGHQPGERNL